MVSFILKKNKVLICNFADSLGEPVRLCQLAGPGIPLSLPSAVLESWPVVPSAKHAGIPTSMGMFRDSENISEKLSLEL